MLDITGAGAQPPMRSHWKLRSGPLSYEKPRAAVQVRQGKHSKRPCQRYRADTATANSKASATGQAAQQPQPAPLSHRKSTHRSFFAAPRLIALDYVLRKGTQSNWSGKQARICVLCDANSPHTARRESKACTSPAPALL